MKQLRLGGLVYLYLLVACLNVSFNRLITWVWEKRADFFAIDFSLFSVYDLEEFPLPLYAWDRLHYLIVVHPGTYIQLLLFVR